MKKSTKYESAVKDAKTLESVIPKQLAEYTTRALSKLNEALGGDVGGYVASYTIAGLGGELFANALQWSDVCGKRERQTLQGVGKGQAY